jgi:hypothetical protein
MQDTWAKAYEAVSESCFELFELRNTLVGWHNVNGKVR